MHHVTANPVWLEETRSSSRTVEEMGQRINVWTKELLLEKPIDSRDRMEAGTAALQLILAAGTMCKRMPGTKKQERKGEKEESNV